MFIGGGGGGGQSLNLSTKAAVFRKVSFLIGGSSMSIGGPNSPGPPWRRLCQDPCFCPGWIGGGYGPRGPPLASPMSSTHIAQRHCDSRYVR